MDSKIHHIVISYDPVLTGRSNLYLDGSHQASGSASIALADFEDEENWLGRSRYESLPFFKGEVHEFRIHNRALTEENVIASRAEGPDQLPGPEISLFKSLPTKIRSGGSSNWHGRFSPPKLGK